MAGDIECVCFTLIVDDIVQPDGKTFMGMLGGGGPQSLFGYQLQRAQASTVGLAAGVGPDVPQECLDWLRGIGADTSGLLLSPELPTPRAWQLFEWDGKRTQVWRVPETDQLYAQLLPSFSQLPPAFQRARSYHVGIHPLHVPLSLLRQLREAAHAAGGLLSAETYTAAESAPSLAQVRQLATCSDILSPNELEAASIVGPGPPEALADRLLDAGARTVAIRLGPDGALVKHGRSGEAFHVPACAETDVQDVTGCGNAFCGAFLASRARGEALQQAGAWGCVAASLIAEQRGVPPLPLLQFREEALRRLDALRPRVTRLSRVHAAAAAPAVLRGSSGSYSRQHVKPVLRPGTGSRGALRSVRPVQAGMRQQAPVHLH